MEATTTLDPKFDLFFEWLSENKVEFDKIELR
jgi:hypothetical protein